jgi:hypothetical protein
LDEFERTRSQYDEALDRARMVSKDRLKEKRYVYVYVFMYIYIHVFMRIFIYMYMYACIFITYIYKH